MVAKFQDLDRDGHLQFQTMEEVWATVLLLSTNMYRKDFLYITLDRVFKFNLSHRSFACWQADLCELGEIFVADPPSSGFMNGGRQNFPPIQTSGMSLSSQANRSSDRLYMLRLCFH